MDENMSNISDFSGGTIGSGAVDSNADISGGGLFAASPGEGMNNYGETASGNGLLTQSIMNNSDKTGESAYPDQFSQSQPGLFMSNNELIKPNPDVLPEPQSMPSYDNSTLGKFSDTGLKENLSLLNAEVQPNNSSTRFSGLSPETASIFRNPLCDSKDNMVYVTRNGNNECYQIDSFLNNLLNSSRENIRAFEYCFNNINEDTLRQSKSNTNVEKYFPMKTNIYKYAAGNQVNSSESSKLFEWVNPITYWSDMYKYAQAQRLWGHDQYPREKNSSMRHCAVSCMVASNYGAPGARVAGAVNELQGLIMHDAPDIVNRITGKSPWAYQWQDLKDNERGFKCSKAQEGDDEETIKNKCIECCQAK